MKTPAHILNDHTPLGLGYHSSWIIKAMKEYAKQWVERAAQVADVTDGECMIEGLEIDKTSILKLKQQIDAQ